MNDKPATLIVREEHDNDGDLVWTLHLRTHSFAALERFCRDWKLPLSILVEDQGGRNP